MNKAYSVSAALVLVLLTTYLFINLVFIYYIGPYAWDDGAITLAYGQTLSNFEKFSLTGVSEIVEGSSSVMMVFLSALVTKIFHFDFYDLISWSQVNALIFTVATLLITYKIIKQNFDNKNYALVITFLVGLFPMYTAEIMNGMEMTVFSTLLLLFILSYNNRSAWIYTLIPLLLLVRFESIFYLVFTVVALFFFDKDYKGFILKIMLTIIIFFLMFTLFRYGYFGDFIPNTILAKMQAPYSSSNLLIKLARKASGGIEFISVFNLTLIIAIALFYLNKYKELKDIKIWLMVSFFIFSLIAGKNLGYDGRMFLAIFPVIVIVFIAQVSNLVNLKLTTLNRTVELTLNEKSRYYLIIFTLLVTFMVNTPLFFQNIHNAFSGGYYQNKYLPKVVFNKINNQKHDEYWLGITPENYKITGISVEKVRKALKIEVIKFMTPDVGGLGLCCEKINVLDSALLTNKYLAKHGYSEFESFLKMKVPDIIETHGYWSEKTKIYDKKYFKDNYIPLVVNMNFLWLNKKHLPSLSKNGNLRKISRLKLPKKIRYLDNNFDKRFVELYIGDFYITSL